MNRGPPERDEAIGDLHLGAAGFPSASVWRADSTRSDALRRRYLQLLAPALRAPAASHPTEPPATWPEISAAWNP